MMGISVPTAETPLVKRTTSILFFSKSRYELVKKRADCIRCSKCIGACPLDLHSITIFEAIEKEMLKEPNICILMTALDVEYAPMCVLQEFR
jgi:Na+-translocating ferredoxin:NAD+ oxidoreductase RnfC subunit